MKKYLYHDLFLFLKKVKHQITHPFLKRLHIQYINTHRISNEIKIRFTKKGRKKQI